MRVLVGVGNPGSAHSMSVCGTELIYYLVEISLYTSGQAWCQEGRARQDRVEPRALGVFGKVRMEGGVCFMVEVALGVCLPNGYRE